MTDLTEVLARALCEWDWTPPLERIDRDAIDRHMVLGGDNYRAEVRAQLAALDAAGYQIVPKEPTMDMYSAMTDAGTVGDDGDSIAMYKAALAAAPKP